MLFGNDALGELTDPFVGAVAPLQVTGVHVGAEPANVPSAWQSRAMLPVSE